MTVQIKCLLGKLVSPDAEVDLSEAGGNSTRWVFDVEQDTAQVQEFRFSLLDNKTRQVKKNGHLSPNVMPLNAKAAQAHIHMPQPNLPTLHIAADNVGVIRYRITLDTTHSLGR